jgi:predicted phage terminase large subunit-like protein
LAAPFIAMIRARYEGTRLGRQELYAEVIEQAEGALWTRDRIEELRVKYLPDLRRIVVAIDPAATSGKESDETGIIVAGIGEDGHGYVFDDLSGQLTPDAWARRAVNAYHEQQADRIVAEVNNGGEMVEFTIRTVDPAVSYMAVHASRGKRTRAEPVAALYEQGKVHHLGMLTDLEMQMCTWSASDGESSPDRVDALVWALTELMLDQIEASGFLEYARQRVAAVKAEAAQAAAPAPDEKPDGASAPGRVTVHGGPAPPVEADEANPWLDALPKDLREG